MKKTVELPLQQYIIQVNTLGDPFPTFDYEFAYTADEAIHKIKERTEQEGRPRSNGYIVACFHAEEIEAQIGYHKKPSLFSGVDYSAPNIDEPVRNPKWVVQHIRDRWAITAIEKKVLESIASRIPLNNE